MIDHVAHAILSSLIESHKMDKPVYSALRIGVSAIAAVKVFNVIANMTNLKSMDVNPALIVIVTAMAIYRHIVTNIGVFNLRYRQYEF